MSSIRVNIDRLVLRGVEPLQGKTLAAALQSHLYEVLGDRSTSTEWARSHRTPVLKLGRIPLEAGSIEANKFGKQVAQAVGKGLKP